MVYDVYVCISIFKAPMHRDLSWSSCLTRGKAQVAPPSDDEEPEPVQEIVSWSRFCGATGDRSNLGYLREAIEQVQNWKRKSNKSSFGCKSWKIYSDLFTLFDQRIIGKRWDVTSQNVVFSAVNI